LAERRKLREGYTRKWTGGPEVVKSTKELPPGQSVGWYTAEYLGNGYIIRYPVKNGITFLHIPPVASQKPVEGWSIPPFAYDVYGHTTYPPGNVIAVAERREK